MAGELLWRLSRSWCDLVLFFAVNVDVTGARLYL